MSKTITLEHGQFGWDYVLRSNSGKTLLIQTDLDYPGVARYFGWEGDDSDVESAQNHLDESIGETVDDPGYFQEESNQ